MGVPGIGAITAYFLATIDDPTRFAHSRLVGAYVGLTSKRYQSGEVDYSGRITRRGDDMVRTLLFRRRQASSPVRVGAAHCASGACGCRPRSGTRRPASRWPASWE
jgi:transposase